MRRAGRTFESATFDSAAKTTHGSARIALVLSVEHSRDSQTSLTNNHCHHRILSLPTLEASLGGIPAWPR